VEEKKKTGNSNLIVIKGISIFLVVSMLFFGFAFSVNATGVSFFLAPSKGTFFIGSTFTVSAYVNTKGNEINVVEVDLKFSPDIIQVTSPIAGESFVSEWLSPPSYSNIEGKISFRGGIPGGIVTSAGLISTITFRARGPGLARLEFLDSSRVLLNDGKGTPVLATTMSGIYDILIPPPEGPKVFSPSHPDSDIWYQNNNPSFAWEKEDAMTDFSFSFSQNPQEEPDTIPEGSNNFKSFEKISDGIWYFHIKAKKEGIWGKTSHAVVKIDTTPPEEFEPKVDTYSKLVYFETRDLQSGVNFYEVSIRDISKTLSQQPFFTEATSPFRIPYEKPGKYSLIVRVFDKASNLREEEIKFQLMNPFISYIEGKGIQLRGFLFSWWMIFLIIFFLISGTGYLIFYLLTQRGLRKGIKEIREALAEIEKIEEREKEARRLKEKFREEREKLEKRLRGENE